MLIKVNIGGTIFETTVNTLKKINYFKYILEDTNYDNTQVIFVDRSAHIFKHILALAIDETYSYPLKYKNELDFYDMTYDINNLYNPLHELKEKINILETQMNTLKKCKIEYCNTILKTDDDFCDCHIHSVNKCLYEKGNYYCDRECDNSRGRFLCELHY